MQATADPADVQQQACVVGRSFHLSGEEEPSREKTNRTKQERRTSYSQLLVATLKIKAQSQGGEDEFSTLALRYFSPG